MKYLILGSNSFAGSCIVNQCLTEENDVIGISRSEQPHDSLLAYANHPNLKRFNFFPLDINNHFDEIRNIISQYKPNYIIDCAGQGMVAESWKAPEQWYQTNIVAKVKLHNFLRHCDFLDRYIRISTPEVYGDSTESVSENHKLNPSTPYAVSHAAIDMSLLSFYRQYQFPVILTRYANFYGPCQQLYRIVPRTIIYILMNKRLPLHGGGKTKRAFIYGEDVANSINSIIKKGKTGETYHFSSGNVISIADLVRLICEMMKAEFSSLVEVSADRPGKDTLYDMDTQKAKNELNWSPKINLSKGVEKSIDWIRTNIDLIKTFPLEYIHKP
ncbi:MAG: hypothetical protein ACD_46C00012G0004 [uncultured bacterium]|nr:MAG: hypothetical protein ACD_46C00012G0004 [uncultured bacterium]